MSYKDKVRSFYDKKVERVIVSKERSHIDMREKSRVLEEANLKPGIRVIDLGCGDADLLVEIAERAEDSRIVGVDFSGGMLGVARSRAAGYGIELVKADVESLPSELKVEYDIVICLGLIEHFKRCDDILSVIYDLTKPGGGQAFISFADCSLHSRITTIVTRLRTVPTWCHSRERVRERLESLGFEVEDLSMGLGQRLMCCARK